MPPANRCPFCKNLQHIALFLCSEFQQKVILCEKTKQLVTYNTETSLRHWLDQETENILSLLYRQKLKGRKKRMRNKQEWVDAIVEIRRPRLIQPVATTHIEPATEDTQQNAVMQQPEEQGQEAEEDEQEEQEEETDESIATPSVTIQEPVSTMSGRIIRPLHRFEPEISRRQSQTMEQRQQRQRDARGARGAKAERQRKTPPIAISQIRYRKGCEFYEEDCPICLDEKSYIITNCKHRFCSCIIKVVIQCRRQDRQPQCPYCRENVTRLQMIHPRFYKIVKNVLGMSKDIVCK